MTTNKTITKTTHRYSVRAGIRAVKDAVAIEDYAQTVAGDLRRSGDTLTARCPAPDHDDKTPSLFVYPETGSFYCYGCNRGGDVIDLYRMVEGGEPWEAMVSLALRYDVELPTRPARWHGWQDEKEKRRRETVVALTRSYQRRYFRIFAPLILDGIEDPSEHEEEARRLWEDFGRVGYSVARRKVYA